MDDTSDTNNGIKAISTITSAYNELGKSEI